MCLDPQEELETREPVDLQVRTVHRVTLDRPVQWEQLDLLGVREEQELPDHVEELEQEL